MSEESKYVIYNSSESMLTFSMPKYICPKHGIHDGGALSLFGRNGEKEGDYCLLCYKEWIKANIPAVVRE